MSQSAKPYRPQGPSTWPARRARAHGAGEAALSHAAQALARAGFTDATLVLRWPETAGAQLARVAEPVKWQDGPEGAVLTLKCEPGALVFLQHETRSLIERLNSYLGAGRIARVKLVPGRLSPAPELPPHPQKARPRPSKPASRGEKRSMADALDALAELRAWRKRAADR